MKIRSFKNFGVSKLPMTFRLWGTGLRPIPSIISSHTPTAEFIKQHIGKGPYFIKPMSGEKGRGTHYCKDTSEALAQLRQIGSDWIIQPFIKNSGDYRLFVLWLHGTWRNL